MLNESEMKTIIINNLSDRAYPINIFATIHGIEDFKLAVGTVTKLIHERVVERVETQRTPPLYRLRLQR